MDRDTERIITGAAMVLFALSRIIRKRSKAPVVGSKALREKKATPTRVADPKSFRGILPADHGDWSGLR